MLKLYLKKRKMKVYAQKADRYAIVAIAGEVTIATNCPKQAASEAKRYLKSYRREAIACRWMDAEELRSHLRQQIERMRSHDRQFNSRLYSDEIRQLEHLIKTL